MPTPAPTSNSTPAPTGILLLLDRIHHSVVLMHIIMVNGLKKVINREEMQHIHLPVHMIHKHGIYILKETAHWMILKMMKKIRDRYE